MYVHLTKPAKKLVAQMPRWNYFLSCLKKLCGYSIYGPTYEEHVWVDRRATSIDLHLLTGNRRIKISKRCTSQFSYSVRKKYSTGNIAKMKANVNNNCINTYQNALNHI